MWGSIIGGALSAGGSLLGGLLGGSGDNYHPEVARNDAYKNYIKSIQAIKDAANKHGFHPLALLGSQPGSGFAAPVPSQAPSWSVGDAIGSGLATAGDLYTEAQLGEDIKEQRAYDESMRRRQDAIDNLRRKEITPEVKLQRENMQLQNDLLRMDIATSRSRLAKMRAEAIGGSQGSVLTPFHNKIELPLSTDAATMQNEFGEVVGDTYGWLRWLESQLTDPRTGEGHAHRAVREALPSVPKAGSWKGLW